MIGAAHFYNGGSPQLQQQLSVILFAGYFALIRQAKA